VSYVERAPIAELAGAVRTVWVQRTGDTPYVQRHLPTGGVELHFPIGGRPQIVGPLTGPNVEVIAPHTTLVGVRFLPGMAPPVPVDELVDMRIGLDDVWGRTAQRLSETVTAAPGPEAALGLLQAQLLQTLRQSDPLMREAVRRLMPWHPVEIGSLAKHLAISATQFRRRCLRLLGVGPKTLQRTLRFQGFLALAQAGAAPSGRRGDDGLAGLAVDVGYTDQAHLSRECARLTGKTPSELLGGDVDRCACGHDHSASYKPFLATRALTRW
jgi:AraC-like DNA-binding protein